MSNCGKNIWALHSWPLSSLYSFPSFFLCLFLKHQMHFTTRKRKKQKVLEVRFFLRVWSKSRTYFREVLAYLSERINFTTKLLPFFFSFFAGSPLVSLNVLWFQKSIGVATISVLLWYWCARFLSVTWCSSWAVQSISLSTVSLVMVSGLLFFF